jgi:hypothetical protein
LTDYLEWANVFHGWGDEGDNMRATDRLKAARGKRNALVDMGTSTTATENETNMAIKNTKKTDASTQVKLEVIEGSGQHRRDPLPTVRHLPPGVIAKVVESEVQSVTMEVTPDQADLWLHPDVNKCQRGIKQGSLQKYVWDINHDQWKENGETIKISKTGKLLDGQHRCLAIKKTGKTTRCLVVFGVDDETMTTIDKGTKRTLRDSLRMMGVANHRQVAEICQAIALLTSKTNAPISDGKCEELRAIHEEGIAWANEVFGSAKVSAGVVASLVWAYPVAKKQIDAFARQFHTNVGILDQKSPVRALQKTIQRKEVGIVHKRRDLMLKTLTCAFYAVQGKTLAKSYTGEVGFEYFTKQREKAGLA